MCCSMHVLWGRSRCPNCFLPKHEAATGRSSCFRMHQYNAGVVFLAQHDVFISVNLHSCILLLLCTAYVLEFILHFPLPFLSLISPHLPFLLYNNSFSPHFIHLCVHLRVCVSIHQYADGRYWVYSPVLGRRKLNSSSSYNVSHHRSS